MGKNEDNGCFFYSLLTNHINKVKLQIVASYCLLAEPIERLRAVIPPPTLCSIPLIPEVEVSLPVNAG
jgi:hypothetical protein